MKKIIAIFMTLCTLTLPLNICALSTETVSDQNENGISFGELTGKVTEAVTGEVTNIRDVTVRNPGFDFKPYIILVVSIIVALLIVGGISIASKKALEKYTTKKK